jgi:DNA-binding response OmpR family regulator
VGANEFMTKPFSVGEVLARARSLLAVGECATTEPV